MKQVLSYEILCPVCQDGSATYQVEEPKIHIVCAHCLSERTFKLNKGFSQAELGMMLELPKLTGSRSQVNWAHRIRLNEIKINPTDELADLVETEHTAKFWIKRFYATQNP